MCALTWPPGTPTKALMGIPVRTVVPFFFINAPGVYFLKKGLKDLHANDFTGILFRPDPVDAECPAEPAVAGGTDITDFDRLDIGFGPCGNKLETYLPKNADLGDKLEPSLTPSLAHDPGAKYIGPREPTFFRVKEKRLDTKKWVIEDYDAKTKQMKWARQGGSHFPLCTFTNQRGHRSFQSYVRREVRKDKIVAKTRGKDAWQRPTTPRRTPDTDTDTWTFDDHQNCWKTCNWWHYGYNN